MAIDRAEMIQLTLRLKRFLVAITVHAGIAGPTVLGIAIASAVDAQGAVTWLIIILVLYFLTFRRLGITAMVERALLTTEPCSVCGYPITLTNWWRCACGFIGDRERHVFLACRNCKREFSWLVCPNCQAQISL